MKRNRQWTKYIRFFSEEGLFDKIKFVAGKMSTNVLYSALVLLLLLSDKNIPFKVRLIFVAALGYFILPTDLIADIIPGLGFADDIAFLSFALSSATEYITPDIQEKARKKLNSLLRKSREEKV